MMKLKAMFGNDLNLKSLGMFFRKMADVPEIPVVNTLIKVALCQKLQQVQAGIKISLRAHSFPFF